MIDVELPEIPDPNDSWARVELYRWQHGCLPNQPGHEEQQLDEAAGLEGMARAIEENKRENFPTPMNVISVLRYAAKRLRETRNEAINDSVNAAKNCLHEAPTPQQDDLMDDVICALNDLKR